MGVMHDGVIYVSLDKREIDHGVRSRERKNCVPEKIGMLEGSTKFMDEWREEPSSDGR